MLARFFIFVMLNFSALVVGGFFTGRGVPSEWYLSLNKAPWTPPGWVFGFAWSTVMFCFSLYMAFLWPTAEDKRILIGLFALQWLLNVSWNPVFFHFHKITAGLVVILSLTLLIGIMLIYFWPLLKVKSLFLLPYLLWLLIATSLNRYIYLHN